MVSYPNRSIEAGGEEGQDRDMKTMRISKVQLLGATKDLASEYLGFTTNVNGANWSIARLEARFQAYQRMVELARRSRVLCDNYTPEERLAIALGGTIDAKPQGPQDMTEAQECSRQANEIWLSRF